MWQHNMSITNAINLAYPTAHIPAAKATSMPGVASSTTKQ